MAAKQDKKIVKKVKAYPFRADVADQRGSHAGSVILLTATGLLVDVAFGALQPGDKVDVQFQLPVLQRKVSFSGVIIKVYNQVAGASLPEGEKQGTVQRLEVHFRTIAPESQTNIASFLEKIGQH